MRAHWGVGRFPGGGEPPWPLGMRRHPLQSTGALGALGRAQGVGQGPSFGGGPGRRAGGTQKLLKISRFWFQSICGARLLTRVALAFSLASAAVGLRWRPLS